MNDEPTDVVTTRYNNGIVALFCDFVEYLCHHPFLVAPQGRFYMTFYDSESDLLTFNIKYELRDPHGKIWNWKIRFECLGHPRDEIEGTSRNILDHLTVFLATIDRHTELYFYDRHAMTCTITTPHLENHGVLQSYTEYNHTQWKQRWKDGKLLFKRFTRQLQTTRSPNIAELGLALFSSCADIDRLEIVDITSPTRLGLLFEACRRGPPGYVNVDVNNEYFDNVASIYIGYRSIIEDGLYDPSSVTYLMHNWHVDPLTNDNVLIDNMRSVVRSTLHDLHIPGAHPQFLETRPDQVLQIQVWCKTADCITPGWVKYLQSSLWFELGALERRPTHVRKDRYTPDYRGNITVVDAHPVTDVIIQLVESEDGISCLNLAGEEILSVPPGTDAQKLRHELAKILPTTNLHLINKHGDTIPGSQQEDVWGAMRGDDIYIPPPPVSNNFVSDDWIWV